MGEVASWSRSGPIAILTIDNPPVNAISQAVRAALVEGVQRANDEAEVAALVISCAGRTFFAGADLKEFGKPSTRPFLTEVVDALEASNKPVVAAIHGSALGGGLEVAMACQYRVATPDAQLGLPEVKLGLMPGARGTQHLPRLVGVEHALQIIALGNPVSGADGHEMGLVDAVADDDLLEAACAKAREVISTPPRRTRELVAEEVAQEVYDEFAKRNARKFRGLDAPPAIIASVRAATELPFEEGAQREREIFLQLREGPQNEALRYAFFAEREAAKIPQIARAEPRQVNSAGVIGSGTMGSGIAIALLQANVPVALYERDPAALERGCARIREVFEANAKSGRMTQAAADRALGALTPVEDMRQLAQADLVIEAAYEEMNVKREIFASLDDVVRPGAILASNTSYLDLDKIAAATSRPQDVIGLHFFSPAHVMKLLEIVRGEHTGPDVIASAFALAKRMKKIAVLSGNAWGFIGNRMLAVRRKHAEAMAVEGAEPARIDRVIERFGMAMGPFRVGDLAGLDLGWSADTSTGSTIRERLCEAGRRGQKTGAGFYDYDSGGKASPSRKADEIIGVFARDNGIERREFSDEEILDRLLWPMVDEGAQLLAEGIAQRESDIDVVWLNGYGWPAWTGGPMFHARRAGFGEVARRLEAMGIAPSDGLRALAAEPAG